MSDRQRRAAQRRLWGRAAVFGLLGGVALLGRALAAEDAVSDRVVEVVQSAYHIPLFHNAYVTVVDVAIPPGKSSDFHHHRDDALNIYLVDYPSTALGQDYGKPVGLIRGGKSFPKAGEASFSAFSSAPIINRGINNDTAGQSLRTVIEVEFTGRHPFGFSPAERDPVYTRLIDNDKVKVWRLALPPGESAALITQSAPGLRAVIHGGEVLESAPGMMPRGMWLEDRKVYWQDGGVQRSIKNIGKTPVMLIEMEIK